MSGGAFSFNIISVLRMMRQELDKFMISLLFETLSPQIEGTHQLPSSFMLTTYRKLVF